MRWEDERYVRLYTRDTADWMGLSWDAQALMMQLVRKVDRAGALPLGRQGRRAVAIVLGQASIWDRLAPALEELMADGCVRISGDCLFIPNFLAAQEAVQSDAQRKRDQREREQARLLAASAPVTFRDEMSRDVTSGHAASRSVTPSVPTLPCLAVPNLSSADSAFAPPPDGSNPVQAMGALVVEAVNAALATTPPARNSNKPRKQRDTTPNPRHAPMVARLVATFLEVRGVAYAFTPRDAKALATLLGVGDDDEIDRRWRRGLHGQFRERCDTLSDLFQRWNALTGNAQQGPPGRPVDIRKSPVRAEDVPRESFAEVGREHGF